MPITACGTPFALSCAARPPWPSLLDLPRKDRKSTRLNSSHANISYAVFCLKKKITEQKPYLSGKDTGFLQVIKSSHAAHNAYLLILINYADHTSVNALSNPLHCRDLSHSQ